MLMQPAHKGRRRPVYHGVLAPHLEGCVCIYVRGKKATAASPKIDFVLTSFQTKVFRALKQCVSGRVPSWSSRCCSSRPTGCCGVANLWVCAPRPSETQKATFSRAGALHLSLLSSILCTGAKLRFSLVRTGGGRSRF